MKSSVRRLPQSISVSLLLMVTLALALSPSSRAQDSELLGLQVAPIAFPNPALAPKTALEFYYLINQQGLDFVFDSANDRHLGEVFAMVLLLDTLNAPVDSASQIYFVRKADDPTNTRKIANALSILAQPGEYTAQFIVIDVVSKRQASRFVPLKLEGPSTDELAFSGIHLGHSLQIVESEELAAQDPLIRNGRRLTPNPSGVYSILNPSISAYIEVYNLQLDEAGRTKMGVRVEMQGFDEEAPRILDERFTESNGSSLVYARRMEHGATAVGRHMLRFIVTDAVTNAVDTSRRVVVFFNPESESTLASESAQESDLETIYGSSDLATRLDIVYWIMTARQRDLIESLTEQGKTQFLEQFWRDNDPDIATRRNEYREEVVQRFTYANERYSSSVEVRDGWRSDPGRVLIQYGMPDEIIENVLPTIENDVTGGDPWERWNYNAVQGGVYFIFSVEQGHSKYYLRHSNAQGERFDRGIEDRINQVFRSSGG